MRILPVPLSLILALLLVACPTVDDDDAVDDDAVEDDDTEDPGPSGAPSIDLTHDPAVLTELAVPLSQRSTSVMRQLDALCAAAKSADA